MEGLIVVSWEHWERLCCYLLSDFVKRSTGVHIRYVTYGNRGQGQLGIDLVPDNPPYPVPIVGQCKMREISSYTWSDVESDLAKTDNYAGAITNYVVFTTAKRHVSVQDKLSSGPYYHKRGGGERFKVSVVYWDDVNDLSCVPFDVCEQIFPGAFTINRTSVVSKPAIEPNILSSLKNLKEFVPLVFTRDMLDWLEMWDFTRAYVPNSIFNQFNDLYIEIDRTEQGMNGVSNFLYSGNRASLAACLPAASRFFSALRDFRDLINAQSIGGNLSDGTNVLWLEGIPRAAWPAITAAWRSAARHLATVFREDVLGEPC